MRIVDRAPRFGGSSGGGEDVLQKENGTHRKAETIPLKTISKAKAVVAE